MSKRSQEKRRTKAREKKLSRRRMLGASPLSRLAGTAEATCECWKAYADDDPMIALHVLRPVRGGQTVAAFFLIDPECIGLKDAHCDMNADPSYLREFLRENSREEGVRAVQVELAEVRALVAGAIRWTRAHPFRLPPQTERCLKIIDGVGDIATADINDFGDEEGGLYYVGREADLARILQGVTLEEFMERDDVTCDFRMRDGDLEYDDEYEEDEDFADGEDELQVGNSEPKSEKDHQFFSLANEMVRGVVEDARRWCERTGAAPAPQLKHAAQLHVACILSSINAVAAGKKDPEVRKESLAAMEDLLDQQPDAIMPDLELGFTQILDSGAGNPDRIIQIALERTREAKSAFVDVPQQNVLPVEASCSTPVSPSSPPSSSTTPAPSSPATTC